MSIGMVGRKIVMTRVFTENGASIPVTVIQVEANRVTQVKNTEKDGYTAIQVTTGTVKQNRLNKPEKGLFAKTGVEAGRGLWEFRIDEKDIGSYKVGDEVKAETVFKDVKRVDVTGTSKGKGTQGTVKRYNFGTQDWTHGNSRSYRVVGSTGQNQTPGRVRKGKKMFGHLGSVRVTVQRLEVVRVDAARSVLLVKGAVPGAINGDVIVKPTVKA